jgi:hypothetical protein
MRRAGHVARMGDRSCVYRVLVEKSDGRRPLTRPSNKLKYNIKINSLNVGWVGMNWTALV